MCCLLIAEKMVTSDAELLRSAATDPKALESLLNRCVPVVRQRLGGRIATVWQGVLSEDDVLQETCLDAFLSIDQFQGATLASFTAWLSRIAENNLVDCVRELKSNKNASTKARANGSSDFLEGVLNQVTASITSPSHAAARREAREAVMCAVESLPERYRCAIQSFDLEGNCADISAAHCQCSVGALHMRRLRAMKLMKAVLSRQYSLID